MSPRHGRVGHANHRHMKQSGSEYTAAFAIASFLGGFAFLYGTNFALFHAAWCIVGEEHCVREWVGALSGWAAAIAAGLAVPVFLSQLREQRIQSEFALGFSKPTGVMHDRTGTGMRDFNANEIRVTNWNRFPVILTSMRLMDGSSATITEVKCQGARIRKNADNLPAVFTFFEYFVDGWENRTQPPPAVIISIKFDDLAEETGDFILTRKPLQVQLAGRIVGSEYEQFSIIVSRPDAILN